MAPHGTLMESLVLTLNVLCGRVLKEGETLESPYMLTPGDTRRAQVIAPSTLLQAHLIESEVYQDCR